MGLSASRRTQRGAPLPDVKVQDGDEGLSAASAAPAVSAAPAAPHPASVWRWTETPASSPLLLLLRLTRRKGAATASSQPQSAARDSGTVAHPAPHTSPPSVLED